MLTAKGITPASGKLLPWNEIKSATRRTFSVTIETYNGADVMLDTIDYTEAKALKRAISTLRLLDESERAAFVGLFGGLK